MLKVKTNGWETERLLSYSLDSTLESGADSFSLEASMGTLGENAGRFVEGADIDLFDSKGEQLLTGVIDEVDEGDIIKVEGRDLMAHAIDDYPNPKRWKDKYPLDVLKVLAAKLPFTSVDTSAVTSAQSKLRAFQIEAGDSYCSAFQELAEEGDFELYVDPLGKLVARNFPDRPAILAFNFISRVGEANCKPELKRSVDEVYSTVKYYVGRRRSPVVQVDSTIAQYVTRTITVRDGDVRNTAQAKVKIGQMFRDMKDRMRRWTVTFGGDHNKFGATPKIGDGVLITSYRHGVENEAAIVWNIAMTLKGNQGRETELELRSREL